MNLKPFSRFTIAESFDNPVEFYMTDDTVMPRAIYAVANVNGTDYGFSLVESLYDRVYILEMYRVVTTKRRFWSFKEAKDVRPVLATLLKFVEACYPFLKNKFDGIIIDIPGKSGSEIYTKFIERVAKKTYINTFRVVPVTKKTEKANNYLFMVKRNVQPTSIFKTAAFHKHFDFDPSGMAYDELFTSDNIDVMNHTKKPEKPSVSLKPSRRFSFTRMEISGDNIDAEYIQSLDDIKNRIANDPSMIKRNVVQEISQDAFYMGFSYNVSLEDIDLAIEKFKNPDNKKVEEEFVPIKYTFDDVTIKDIKDLHVLPLPTMIAVNAILGLKHDYSGYIQELTQIFEAIREWKKQSEQFFETQRGIEWLKENPYVLMPLEYFNHKTVKWHTTQTSGWDAFDKASAIQRHFNVVHNLRGLNRELVTYDRDSVKGQVIEAMGGLSWNYSLDINSYLYTAEKFDKMKKFLDKTESELNKYFGVPDEQLYEFAKAVMDVLALDYSKKTAVEKSSSKINVEVMSLEGVALPLATEEPFSMGNDHIFNFDGESYFLIQKNNNDGAVVEKIINSPEVKPFYDSFRKGIMNGGGVHNYDKTRKDFIKAMYENHSGGKEWFKENGWTEDDINGARVMLKYTGNYYRKINGALRNTLWGKKNSIKDQINSNTPSYDVDMLYQDVIDLMEFFERKATPLPYDMWVYRNSKVKDIEDLKVGDDYTDAGFWSVSTQSTIGINTSSGIRSKIFLPKGSRVLPVFNNSSNAGEGEMLLAPMSVIKVLKIVKKEGLKYGDVNRGLIGIYTGNALGSLIEAEKAGKIAEYLSENKKMEKKDKENQEDSKWNQEDISVADMKKVSAAIAKGKMTKKL